MAVSDNGDFNYDDLPRDSYVDPSAGNMQGITDPTVRSPSPPSLPTGPVSSDYDPRISDAQHANDPEVLAWLNRPGGPGNPTPPSAPPASTGGVPATGTDPGLQAYIAQWASSNPGANPSVGRDPGYWAGRIAATHGAGPIDWGYWNGRFMQPEGPPEGAAPPAAAPPAAAPPAAAPAWWSQPPAAMAGPAPNQGDGTTFADPAYQALNALAQARITSLQQPQSFPQLDALVAQLQQQQAVNKQRAGDLAGQWGSRVTELQKPLLTTPQVVQQRALAENNLLGSRDAALANAKASQSARGFAPTSGLADDQARQINENASNQQAQIEARLQQGNIGTDEARRNEATQLQGLITQALNGGDATSLQEQAQVADLENQRYQTDQQRQIQQLGAAEIPVSLTNTGFNNASGAVSSPNSAFSALMPLIMASLTGQSNQFTQANSQASGLSQIISSLFGL